MYILKNALRCLSRSVGRQVLIGIIVLAIGISACLGLSIRQAAESAREDTLSTLSVTATISFDRNAAMEEMRGEGTPPEMPEGGEGGGFGGSFDRGQFAEMMGGASSLSLEEYQTYAKAASVKDFTYTLSVTADGSEDFQPVSNETEDETGTESETTDNTSSQMPSMPGGMGGFGGGRFEMIQGAQADFTLTGYSSEKAMTAFQNSTAKITDGAMFTEGGADYDCIISEELATFNELAVGDTVTLTNPNSDTETYTLTVVGIYADTAANQNSFSMMGSTSTDPANQIYLSHTALQKMVDASEKVSTTQTDEDTGRSFETKLTGNLAATYSFATVEDYEAFEDEARDLGLSEDYTVSSSDVTAFEASLTPLNTLSTMAGYFLLVILIIGAVILIVLNIFNVRERKYEIGVLTAMGMKKSRVAMQFLTEIFVVTLAAVIISVIVGSVASVPVANALLENQITSGESQNAQIEENFGRGDFGGMTPPDMPSNGGGNQPGGPQGGFFGQAVEYVSDIDAAMNLTVVWQMLGIAVLLTLASGAVSMLFVMRYEPLKILANRD